MLFNEKNLPKIGQIFWLILPSIESKCYGDYSSKEPWRGQVISNDREVLWIGKIGYDGSVDRDSNASTYVKDDKELFLTESEARAGFLIAFKNQIAEMEIELESNREKLKQLEKEWS